MLTAARGVGLNMFYCGVVCVRWVTWADMFQYVLQSAAVVIFDGSVLVVAVRLLALHQEWPWHLASLTRSSWTKSVSAAIESFFLIPGEKSPRFERCGVVHHWLDIGLGESARRLRRCAPRLPGVGPASCQHKAPHSNPCHQIGQGTAGHTQN